MKKIFTLSCIAVIFIQTVKAQSPNWLWATNPKGPGHDYAQASSTDANGNTYVTGNFQAPMDIFDLDTLTTVANGNFFVAKYDSSGNVIWAKGSTATGPCTGTGVIQDAMGNCIAAGYYQSNIPISFGNITLNPVPGSVQSAFIVKYDSAGNVLWAKNAGEADWIPGSFTVGLDGIGNVFLTGTFTDSTYLVKYDSMGNQIYRRFYNGGNSFTPNVHPWSLCVDGAGNSFITGYFSATSLSFLPFSISNASSGYEIFIVKCDSSGNVIWARSDGNYYSLYKPYISCDAFGNSYITGYFNGTLAKFGNIILNNAGLNDIFIVKYNSQGNVSWAKRAGGINFDDGNGIVTDASGNSYLTGMFRGTATFGSITLYNGTDPQIFVAKYDSAGTVLWAKSAGGSDVDQGWGVGFDAADNCYITGNFFSTVATFGSISLPNSAPMPTPSEIFVAKLSHVATTSITEIKESEQVFVFPNPAQDNLTITSKDKLQQIILLDISGREILRQAANGNEITLHDLSVAPGIYFAKISTAKGEVYRKIEVN